MSEPIIKRTTQKDSKVFLNKEYRQKLKDRYANFINRQQLAKRRLEAVKTIIGSGRKIESIPNYIPEAELLAMRRRTYYRKRSLKVFDENLINSRLPSLSKIISGFKKSKIKVFEVGAGNGQLSLDLLNLELDIENDFPKIEYHGIDALGSERNRKVRRINISDFEFPKSSFDLIASQEVFHYIPNKLSYIEKCCNALQINGKFVLSGFGKILVDGVLLSPKLLKDIIEKYNKGILFVEFSPYSDSIIITRLKSGIIKFPFDLIKVTPQDKDAWEDKYSNLSGYSVDYDTTALISYYKTKINAQIVFSPYILFYMLESRIFFRLFQQLGFQ